MKYIIKILNKILFISQKFIKKLEIFMNFPVFRLFAKNLSKNKGPVIRKDLKPYFTNNHIDSFIRKETYRVFWTLRITDYRITKFLQYNYRKNFFKNIYKKKVLL